LKKKVVLIAAARDFVHFGPPRKMMVPAPPLNTLALGSYLTKHGVEVELIDMQVDFGVGLSTEACFVVYRRLAEYLRKQADSIAWIGISQTASMDNGIGVASALKEVLPKIPLIFGGYLPSRVYARLLEEHPHINAIVRGDGEHAALKITRLIEEGRPFCTEEVPNLAWLEGNEVRTAPRQSVPPADIPLVDFGMNRNPDSYPLIYLLTSRGCPFKCTYCLEPEMRPYSVFEKEWLAAQLDHVESVMRADKVSLIDPIFAVGRRRTLDMCEVLKGRSLTYIMETRVDVLAPDLVPFVREAGIEIIYFGFESASPSTLVRMNKVRSEAQGKKYVEKARAIFRACFEHDVTPQIGFMLSFPGDTLSDYDASLQFIHELRDIYESVAERTGIETGFSVGAYVTQVFSGTLMERQMGNVLPDVEVTDEWAMGSTTVISASEKIDAGVNQRYRAEMESLSEDSPLATGRNSYHRDFSVDEFAESNADLVDDEGVVRFSDRLFMPDAIEAPQ
jgi:radical SAM superfamily enzyme YgiQ (UPF0313 family)